MDQKVCQEYRTIRQILIAEHQRRQRVYRFRPYERAGKIAEVANALAALERLAQPPARPSQPTVFWQDKFDL